MDRGWVDGRMDEWIMKRWMMERWIDRWMNGSVHEWMDGRMDG